MSGYFFILRSPNHTANQICRSYKIDQSNIFVTVYFVTRMYNLLSGALILLEDTTKVVHFRQY